MKELRHLTLVAAEKKHPQDECHLSSFGLILSVHSQAKLVIVKINPQHCNKIFPLEVEIKIHVC